MWINVIYNKSKIRVKTSYRAEGILWLLRGLCGINPTIRVLSCATFRVIIMMIYRMCGIQIYVGDIKGIMVGLRFDMKRG